MLPKKIDWENKVFIYLKSMAEYFSEGYRCYIKNPEILRNKNKDLYNFIKRIGE